MTFDAVVPIEQITDGTPITYGVVQPGVEDPSGVRFVRGGDVFNGRINVDGLRTISHELSAQYKRTLLRGGELLISLVGNPGEVAIAPPSLAGSNIARQVGLIRVDETRFNPWFVLYYLMSPAGKAQLFSYSLGSVQSVINLKELRRVQIPAVSRRVQDAIVEALKGIDDKIDLNRRINQTLEAMAQAIFKSWFVDFDPVKAKIAAKAEGRDPLRAAMTAISGKPDTELDTLPPDQFAPLAATAALFPDEMEDSELGEIPKGWQVKTLMQIARFPAGKIDVASVDTSTYVSTENMLENRGGICEASSLPSVATVPSFSSGQVLVSNIRPYFKKIWLARFAGGRSNDVLAFQPLDGETSEFLFNLLYQDQFFEFMNRTAKGAKMPRGDKDAIAGWKFVCADSALLQHFSAKVRSSYGFIDSLGRESKLFAAARDALLPKLLSGDLQVHNAEAEATA